MSLNAHSTNASTSASRGDEISNEKYNEVVPADIRGTTSRTYSQATNKTNYLSNPSEVFPKKDQAIIIPSKPEITTEQYIKAISEYVSPQNILYAQKISNHRMCIFLKSKNIVDTVMEKTDRITINEQFIPIRRLVTPAKKIIITGGSPIIPHVQIEKMLSENGIKLVSGITFMRSAIKSPEFSHIQSFNRQFYANMSQNPQIPETLTITYENETYRLFLNVSGICYKCRKEGHLVKECPLNMYNVGRSLILPNEEDATDGMVQTSQSSITHPQIEEFSTLSQPFDIPMTSQPLADQVDEAMEFEILEINQPSQINEKKRTKTNTTSSQSELYDTESSTIQTDNGTIKSVKKKRKKKKTVTTTPIEDLLDPLKEAMLNDPTEYILDFETFKKYIIETKGSKNIKEITATYTANPDLMINLLQKLHPDADNPSVKARLTTLMKALENIQETSPPPSNDKQ